MRVDPQQRSLQTHELSILDELKRASPVSQRELADRIGVSLGFLNRHLRRLIDAGYVRVDNRDVKPFAYQLTPHGSRYSQQLRYAHYQSVIGSLSDLEHRIRVRLHDLKNSGFRRLAFYGAGHVMEVSYPLARALELDVVAVVDDDPARQGWFMDDLCIEAPESLSDIELDAILVTSLRYAQAIASRAETSVRSTRIVCL